MGGGKLCCDAVLTLDAVFASDEDRKRNQAVEKRRRTSKE